MAIRKQNVILQLANSFVIDSPQPSNINYWWNLGSLLAVCLIIQLATGIFLAMHYSSNITLAFSSVEHIMRDVNYGWAIRYAHSNGASFFFVCVYLHMARGLYYGSYRSPRILLWTIGVVIFLIMIITAFMGKQKNSPKLNNNINYNKFNNNIWHKKQNFNIKLARNYYINSIQDNTNPQEILNYLDIKVIDYWENFHLDNVRSNIISYLKNKGGIYIIINKITRDCYVGSAINNKIYSRWSNHLLNFNGSKLIKNAVLKDGLNNFIVGILEYYPATKENQNNLFELESMYIKTIMPKYNILIEANKSTGYKHTDEDILKMKLLFNEERRELLRKLQQERKGKWSEESKNKLRIIALNRPKNYLNEEVINKISKASNKEITIYNINKEYVCKFKNYNQAAHYLNTSYKTIQRALLLGWIYIPNILISNLNDNYISINNSLINNISKEDLYYKNTKNQLTKKKSNLANYNWNTKYIIKN